jgi:hypothetical protein
MSILFVMTLWCQTPDSSRFKDVVFVQQAEQKGSYRSVVGQIKDLKSSHLIIESPAGGTALYTREVVQRILLDTTRAKLDPINYKSWRELVNANWNADASLLVSVVSATPVDGNLVKDSLAKLPSGIDSVVALVILLLTLCYVVYWAYDFALVSRRAKGLDQEKLQMEIAKLRFEIASLKKKLGVPETVVPVGEREPTLAHRPIDYSHLVNLKEVARFVKDKLLRVPSEEQKRQTTEQWLNYWKRYEKKSRWLSLAMYLIWLALNYVVTAFIGLIFLGSVVDIFLTPSFTPSGDASIFLSLFFLLLSIICLAFLVRLHVLRVVVRRTHKESSSSGA